MTLWQRVVQANRPGPPEHSIQFRVASAATVVIAIAACWSQGELGAPMALFAMVATIVGNVLSYWRRQQPWPLVKPILAVCAVGGFVWFIVTASHTATPGDISTVEGPLAVLFAWVLSTHAFDVPARRDVAYSLAGSAALMAVAAAQSVDLTLGAYVVGWIVFGLWGLVAMWQSMSGARGAPWLTLALTGVAVFIVAALLVSVLPAPKVSTSLIFPSSSANSSPVNSPNNLTDGSASLPAHAASPSGRTGVGGFLGFAKSLDTGVRASLGNQVVMRVRASKPSFWVGQTYDKWDGQSWVQSAQPAHGSGVTKLQFGPPFTIPVSPDQSSTLATGSTDVQTFYLAQSGPNLVFHADNAQRAYIQSRYLFLTGDGTIVSATSMGAGTVYTVVSNDNTATAQQLRDATTPLPASDPAAQTLRPDQQDRYLQLPHPYPRVQALAQQITASIGSPGDANTHTYDKVAAVEAWMSSHITYTTDIPPLAPGADAVDTFLFGSRRGFCEQISTATVVMLRSLGIPARETVGYVPGSYNPITDLYDVEAGSWRAALVGAALTASLVWVVWGPVRETQAVAGSPATSAAYYVPVERFLASLRGAGPVRVEVPLTRTHWEAALLAPKVSLARGWEKQLDSRFDGALLSRALDASSYDAWLHRQAVAYVALPDVPLDPSSAPEGRLIAGGLAYLTPVFRSRHWRIYRVASPTPLVSGRARLTRLGHESFALHADAAGRFLVRVHFTRYWTFLAGAGCVAQAPGDWTAVSVARPGTVVLAARFSLSRAFAGGGSCTG